MQAYAGFKICYPSMPLIDTFALAHDVSLHIDTAVVLDREGVVPNDVDWTVWDHNYGEL